MWTRRRLSGRVRCPGRRRRCSRSSCRRRLVAAVREHARASGRTISAVVAQALEEFLARSSRESVRAGERAGGRDGVRVRPPRGGGSVGGLRDSGASSGGPASRAGQEGRSRRDERGDLRAGVLAPGRRRTRRSGRRPRRCASTPGRRGLSVPEEWVFEDEGHSGATLVRPAPGGACGTWSPRAGLDVVLCLLPGPAGPQVRLPGAADRGVRPGRGAGGVRQGRARRQPRRSAAGAVPGHVRRVREGPADGTLPARQGPPRPHRVGERAVAAPRSATGTCARATWPGPSTRSPRHEAALVAEMFRRYADEGASIADLARWLTGQGVSTRTGKHRWDRSVIWGMLRNPAYAGHGGVRQDHGRSRACRAEPRRAPAGTLRPRAVKTVDRPGEEWTKIPVPAIVSTDDLRAGGPAPG